MLTKEYEPIFDRTQAAEADGQRRPLPKWVWPWQIEAAGFTADPSARIDRRVYIERTCEIGSEVRIAHGCLLQDGAKVGARAEVQPYVRLGDRCQVGEGCELGRGALLLDEVTIGNYVEIGPMAVLSEKVRIGSHSSVRAKVRIGPNTVIGERCSLLEGATVGAGCTIGDAVRISTGAYLGDGVRLAENVFVGNGASIHNGAEVGEKVRIGAGVSVAPEVKLDPLTSWSVSPFHIRGSDGPVYVCGPGMVVAAGHRLNIGHWLESAEVVFRQAFNNKSKLVREYRAYIELAGYWMELHGYLRWPEASQGTMKGGG
jgi:UDP-3-O-[3-hydroxymyristoyl] glucosamine N-acyltransferase